MLNYVDHRAIFEGMNANLWAPNSGRMLWMTQPAWPSTMWQILSSDYDTQASFYGTKIACEPLHVQLNLATGAVDVVNTTPQARAGLKVRARVLSLKNASLFDQQQAVDLNADDMAHTLHLDLPSLEGDSVVLVVLDLTGSDGSVLSHNVYWLAKRSENLRALDSLPTVTLKASATVHRYRRGSRRRGPALESFGRCEPCHQAYTSERIDEATHSACLLFRQLRYAAAGRDQNDTD